MMEGGQSKDSKASSDEIDSPELVSDDAGTGRSYECIFCKRGFTTAQALGGHMNIHRKDRAKLRQNPVPSFSGKHDEESENYGYHLSYQNQRSYYPPVSESLKNFAMCLPTSSSLTGEMRVPCDDDDVYSRRPRELSLFGEELNLGLSMHVDGVGVEDGEEKRDEEVEGEVDLELRLGHEP